MGQGGGRWFGDDSCILYLLGTLFLLWWHQFHLKSSDIRSHRLGTPALEDIVIINCMSNGISRKIKISFTFQIYLRLWTNRLMDLGFFFSSNWQTAFNMATTILEQIPLYQKNATMFSFTFLVSKFPLYYFFFFFFCLLGYYMCTHTHIIIRK